MHEKEQHAARGWPVRTLENGHLNMAVDPDTVASAIVGLMAAIGAGKLDRRACHARCVRRPR